MSMRLIARSSIADYYAKHPTSKVSLENFTAMVKAAKWQSMNDVQQASSAAKPLNAVRAKFEIGGGNFRLIAAFNFPYQIAYVKFIGTHAEYDKIDALTVSMF